MRDFDFTRGIAELSFPLVILLIFYLYLLVRWQHVKRPLMVLVGAAGLLFAMVGRFFLIGHANWGTVVMQVFDCIALVIAFVGAVGACYGAKLPMNVPHVQEPPQ
jgi:hypothetical protein